jgi:hypothetical protein
MELASEPGDILIIRARGACDITAIHVVNQTLGVLLGLGFTRMILDLRELQSLRLGSIAALRHVARRSRALGGRVVVLCAPQHIREPAHLSYLICGIPVFLREAEAVDFLRLRGPGRMPPR